MVICSVFMDRDTQRQRDRKFSDLGIDHHQSLAGESKTPLLFRLHRLCRSQKVPVLLLAMQSSSGQLSSQYNGHGERDVNFSKVRFQHTLITDPGHLRKISKDRSKNFALIYKGEIPFPLIALQDCKDSSNVKVRNCLSL